MKEMTTISGEEVEIVGSTLLTHKKTRGMKYFVIVHSHGYDRSGKEFIALQTSDTKGMTQKIAATLPKGISCDRINFIHATTNGYV